MTEQALLELPGLPNELLLVVLTWLPGRDLVACSKVCRRLRGLVRSRAPWRHAYLACSSVLQLQDGILAAPQWDTLVLRMQDLDDELVVHFEEDARRVLDPQYSP